MGVQASIALNQKIAVCECAGIGQRCHVGVDLRVNSLGDTRFIRFEHRPANCALDRVGHRETKSAHGQAGKPAIDLIGAAKCN